jgi:Mg2+-importing ATPase
MEKSVWLHDSDFNKLTARPGINPTGLSSKEAYSRLKTYGENELRAKNRLQVFIGLFIKQFSNLLILVLIFASVLSFLLGQNVDALVILFLVIISGVFGFMQEYKAENSIEKIRKYLSNRCRVLRDGSWIELNSQFLVPGDIVQLRSGDRVSADIRLFEAQGLTVNESIITGESLPVEKGKSHSSNLQDQSSQRNVVYAGSTIFSGSGKGVVVATGSRTFFGRSQEKFVRDVSESDFEKQIKVFGGFIFKVIAIMTLAIFLMNSILGKNVFGSFLFAIALAIGVTPEMLPAIITVSLSRGALKMSEKKVIVKRLSAVENLGNMDTLCMDKTGTLTEGRFSLIGLVDIQGKVSHRKLLKEALICTTRFAIGSDQLTYDPHDSAIWVYAKGKSKKILSDVKFINENTFDYQRRRMSVCYKEDGKHFLVTKGSVQSILSCCSRVNLGKRSTKMTKSYINKIVDISDRYDLEGYRVLGLAKKRLLKANSSKEDESKMEFLGFLLFKDPVKESAREIINRFESLGVGLKIISGDSLAICTSVARQVGLDFSEDEVITGEELSRLDESNFSAACREKKVFARVFPEQKYAIVRSLNYEGHIVGFLGDGINDVGALKEADVGISVDSGSDITKDVSDIVLLQKDLNVLSVGIEMGRKTFANIMKYILNTISANYGNMFTVAVSSLFIRFIPLLPSQILLNNFVSDIPLFAVATDNVDSDMLKKPRGWNINYIMKFMISYGFVSSFFDLMLIVPMIFFLNTPPQVFRTAWFVESSISEILVTFVIRTRLPFYKSRPSSFLVALSMASIIFVIFMPFLGWRLFQFESLSSIIWLLIFGDLVLYFLITEFAKRKFFSEMEKIN